MHFATPWRSNVLGVATSVAPLVLSLASRSAAMVAATCVASSSAAGAPDVRMAP